MKTMPHKIRRAGHLRAQLWDTSPAGVWTTPFPPFRALTFCCAELTVHQKAIFMPSGHFGKSTAGQTMQESRGNYRIWIPH
jgi:hypothetical protein